MAALEFSWRQSVTLEIDPATLADALPGLVWLARPDGDLDFVNRRWLEFAGIRREAATLGGWSVLAHPDDLVPLRDHWRGLGGPARHLTGKLARSRRIRRTRRN